jgi:hypothetical protein
MANNRTLACALAAGFSLAPLAANAVTAGGATFPDTYPVDGETLHVNGAGVRVFFGIVNGYASALYVRTPAHTADAVINQPGPKVLYTQYLHDAGLGQLRGEFANVHDHYCAKVTCTPANEASYNKMVASLSPISKGETSTYIITDTSFQILRDNKPVMTLDNPTYGASFLQAAIGPTSPTPGYRAGVLGNSN